MTSFMQDDVIGLEIKDAWISCHFDLTGLPIPAKGANLCHNLRQLKPRFATQTNRHTHTCHKIILFSFI